MKRAQIEAVERTESGTAACRRLRKEGKIPASLYGLAKGARALQIARHDLQTALELGVHIFELSFDGKTQVVLVKDLQYDALGTHLLHADFQRVDRDTPVHVFVPVRYIGTAPAVANSIVEKLLEDIQVECLPLKIPTAFVINLSKLAVDDHISVGDLEMPEGCVPYHHNLEDPVVVNHVQREVVEVEPTDKEAAPLEPEVIGKGKADEEDD